MHHETLNAILLEGPAGVSDNVTWYGNNDIAAHMHGMLNTEWTGTVTKLRKLSPN